MGETLGEGARVGAGWATSRSGVARISEVQLVQDLISTLLVLDRPEDASIFPQVGHDSSHPSFQNVYWRCIACFFATSARQNPGTRHALFTNADVLPIVDGLDMGELLCRLNVDIVRVPITHRLGRNRVTSWNNVFYILDVIAHLTQEGGFDRAVVMDSDCVWVRPADGLMADLSRHRILSMSIPYAYDEKLNNASRRDMVRAAQLVAKHRFDFIPNFSGGEIFAATRDGMVDIHAAVSGMWHELSASPPGDVPIYTEEHLLSIAYEMLGVPTGTADAHIRRLWTALRLNNVTAEDIDSGRCAWHLPMEKKTGFVDLFDAVRDRKSWLWTLPPTEARTRIARVMGLPNRSPRQWALQVQSRMWFYAGERLSRMKTSLLPG